MPAFCAAFGSFHVKSSSTSFMMVLTTVCVLPFFLTVTFIRSGTLMVSTFGARWYADQRYRSMQISATRHSSGVSMELNASFAEPCTGSGVLACATCTDGVSGRGIGRGSGKAASRIATLVTATPCSPVAVACGASMGSALAVADVAQLPSVGAAVFSMPEEPKRAGPPATQPARTTVPQTAANRRGLNTPSPPVSSKAPPEPMDHARKKTAGYHFFRNVLPEYNPGRDQGELLAQPASDW